MNIFKLSKFILLLCVCLFSAPLHAENTHHFTLGLSQQAIEYEVGESTYQSISGTAFFQPVQKSMALPYSRTAFYSRTGSFSLVTAQQEWKDMNVVMGGRIFRSGDTNYYSAGIFLAKKELPVWANLRYQYLDERRYNFADGSFFTSPSESIKQVTLGWYIQDTLSIQAIYVNQEQDLYGGSVTKLFNLGNFGFLELSAQLTQTKKQDRVDLSTNTVRYIGVSSNRERFSTVSVAYFPFVETELWFSYQDVDHRSLGVKTKYLSTGIEHYIFDDVRLGFRYMHKDTDAVETYGNSNTYNVSLSFEL